MTRNFMIVTICVFREFLGHVKKKPSLCSIQTWKTLKRTNLYKYEVIGA